MTKLTLPLASLLILSLWVLTSCSNIKDVAYINELTQEHSPKNRLERITNLWVGHFSNRDNINNSTIKVEQEIIGRRIWKKNRVGEYWLYLGWFQTNSYESAIASSIVQITKISPDTAFITFYKIKEEVAIQNYEWTKDAPFDDLKPSDLQIQGKECGSFLVEGQNGNYNMIASGPCYHIISDKIKYQEFDAIINRTSITSSVKLLDSDYNVVLYRKNSKFFRLNRSELEKKYESFVLAD